MPVRVLMLEAPEALLEERARLGIDRWDEMWEGVLHVVPAPNLRHQKLAHALAVALDGVVRDHGLELSHETNLIRSSNDYRIPDLAIYRAADETDLGIRAAVAVIEVVSPGDQSWEKLAFYFGAGVAEAILVDRDTLEVSVIRGLDEDGIPLVADDTAIESISVTIERISEERLRLHWPDGSVDAEI